MKYTITLDGIDIEVEKKSVKNINLRIRKDGSVHISAPTRMTKAQITAFAEKYREWIAERVKNTPPKGEKTERYYTGADFWLWGKKFRLVIYSLPSGFRPFIRLTENGDAEAYVHNGTTQEQFEDFLVEWYRNEMKEVLAERIPVWEKRTGLKCSSWHTKYMTTRWGTCNHRDKRLWFNVQLVRRPPECLDYVIVHELTHIIEPGHTKKFWAHVEKYVPDWKETRALMNENPEIFNIPRLK